MATPGNFGRGSTGPDQFFLGITRAPPSAPGRGRAQGPVPVRRNPNPQTTEHERAADESGSQFKGFLFSKAIRGPACSSSVRSQFHSSAFDSWV
jgi:hypothetical protein